MHKFQWGRIGDGNKHYCMDITDPSNSIIGQIDSLCVRKDGVPKWELSRDGKFVQAYYGTEQEAKWIVESWATNPPAKLGAVV